MTKLTREFFNRPTLEVVQALLGKILVFGNHRAVITETEAYIGLDDSACHAYTGRTKRTEVIVWPAWLFLRIFNLIYRNLKVSQEV